MIRVHVFCEGQTEETFVRDVLSDHLVRQNVLPNSIVLSTSSSAKGGIVSFEKVRRQIVRKCKEDTHSFVTTMIDYYGLPVDFPGNTVKERKDLTIFEKVQHLENAFAEKIDCPKFIPYFMAHEFEALLFTKPSVFSSYLTLSQIGDLERQKAQFGSPEEINDSPATAPSKRILKVYPSYQKVQQGSLIAQAIGLDEIRKACSHFDRWLTKIEALALNNGSEHTRGKQIR